MSTKAIRKQVFWEECKEVKDNEDISPDQIFKKCKTDHFPYGAVSVRLKTKKKGTPPTVYLKDEVKTNTYSGGYRHDYCDSELKVELPMKSNWNGEDYNYSMEGTLPSRFSLKEFSKILEYIREQSDKMLGQSHNIPRP